MAIRLPKIPQPLSNDYVTNFKMPGDNSYRNIPQPWSGKVPVKSPRIYGAIDIPIYTTDIAKRVSDNISGADPYGPDNYTAMNEFNDPGFSADSGSSTVTAPYIPPVNPLAVIYDVVALGFNFFSGMQKADAQEQEAAERLRYYNDLATYEEKTARLQAWQILSKNSQLTEQSNAIRAEQNVAAAAAGYSGQSLIDLQNSDAMSFRIDKELIKESSRMALQQGYEKAGKIRRAGSLGYDAAMDSADQTRIGTIVGLGGQFFGGRK